METKGKLTYLAAADQETAFFSAPDELERSLVLNLLLQPNTMFVPDIFCCLPLVANHVLASENRSLFEAALGRGYLRVAKRFSDSGSFSNLGQRIVKQGIVGIDYRWKDVAYRLDCAVDRLGVSPFFDWPDGNVISAGLLSTLKTVFSGTPPSFSELVINKEQEQNLHRVCDKFVGRI